MRPVLPRIVVLAVAVAWLGSACAAPSPACRALPATANPAPPTTAPAPVLFLLSAASTQQLADTTTRSTGVFLNELVHAHHAVLDAGHPVVFATPQGRPPAIDPESLKPRYWDSDDPNALDRARAWAEGDLQAAPRVSLKDALARHAEFAALVIPGGQGVMVDLLRDATAHTLLARFGADARPVGLICHAPALLAYMPQDTNPFRGRRVTSVSALEEWYIETLVMGAEAQDRAIGDRLDAVGMRYDSGFPGRGHAVRDGNLVTSQNPFSGDAFAAAFTAALRDWRRGVRYTCPNAPAALVSAQTRP